MCLVKIIRFKAFPTHTENHNMLIFRVLQPETSEKYLRHTKTRNNTLSYIRLCRFLSENPYQQW